MEDRSRRRARLVLIVGLLFAVGAGATTFFVAQTAKSEAPAPIPTSSIVVAAREIPPKTQITAADLKLVKMNNEAVPPAALTKSEGIEVIEHALVLDLLRDGDGRACGLTLHVMGEGQRGARVELARSGLTFLDRDPLGVERTDDVGELRLAAREQDRDAAAVRGAAPLAERLQRDPRLGQTHRDE